MTATINTDTPAYIVNGTLTDGEAWVPLSTTILGSSTSSIGFTSTTGANDWSQYQDLMLVGYLRSDEASAGAYLRCQINGSGLVTDGYDSQGAWSTGATMSAWENAYTNQNIIGYITAGSATANQFSAVTIKFHDINSGKNKTGFAKCAVGTGDVNGYMSVWNFTAFQQAPLTSFYLIGYPAGSDTMATGCRVDLFGILPRMVS
jgi:hypothetical protein